MSTPRTGTSGDDLRLTLPNGVRRGAACTIRVDGRPLEAFEGETVAAVLFAHGIIHVRDTMMGDPRGVFCGMGVCFDCLVAVDGIPNTRACMTWVSDGMDVRLQAGPAPADEEGR